MSWKRFKGARRPPSSGVQIEREYLTIRALTKRQYLRDLELAGKINQHATRYGRLWRSPGHRLEISLPNTLGRLDAAERHAKTMNFLAWRSVKMLEDIVNAIPFTVKCRNTGEVRRTTIWDMVYSDEYPEVLEAFRTINDSLCDDAVDNIIDKMGLDVNNAEHAETIKFLRPKKKVVPLSQCIEMARSLMRYIVKENGQKWNDPMEFIHAVNREVFIKGFEDSVTAGFRWEDEKLPHFDIDDSLAP